MPNPSAACEPIVVSRKPLVRRPLTITLSFDSAIVRPGILDVSAASAARNKAAVTS